MTRQSGARVLVVDDEPHLLELLVDVLSTADIEVTAASSGRQAIALAGKAKPDIIVADLYLGDCTGLEVIDRLRVDQRDLPAVVITGGRDPDCFSEASRRKPIELLTKPLDVVRLQRTVREELARQQRRRLQRRRTKRLLRLARSRNIECKSMHEHLDGTCADLVSACRTLSSQFHVQEVVLEYQRDLLSAKNDHDVFRALFRLFVSRCGPTSGVALVCDAEANLQMVGRFGVPKPDNARFCEALAKPMIETLLGEPRCTVTDAGQEAELFDPAIRKFLVGLTVLAVPLIPEPGELIGVALLYRKGEQPILDRDVALANMLSFPTALAIRRND